MVFHQIQDSWVITPHSPVDVSPGTCCLHLQVHFYDKSHTEHPESIVFHTIISIGLDWAPFPSPLLWARMTTFNAACFLHLAYFHPEDGGSIFHIYGHGPQISYQMSPGGSSPSRIKWQEHETNIHPIQCQAEVSGVASIPTCHITSNI